MYFKKSLPSVNPFRKLPPPYRHITLSLIMVIGVMAVGTIGYMLIERWPLLNSLYMTVITAATVGFKEIEPLSYRGVVFTIILILIGIFAFAFTFGSITELFVRGTFQNYIGRARMEKEIKKLNHHYIICGYGRMGKTIGEQFTRQNLPFVAVDTDETVIQNAREEGVLAVYGDAGTETVLMEAGVNRAKALVCTCTDDANNLLVTLTARGINDSMFIVARAEEPMAEKKLKQVGADKIISPYYLGALRISQAVTRPAALNFIESSTLNHEFGLAIDELPVGKTSQLAERTILDSKIKDRFDVMILCITHSSGKMNFNPVADTVITSGDKLILMGDQKNLVKLAEWSGV